MGTPEEQRTDYTFDKVTSITNPSVYPGASKVTIYAYDEMTSA
ncbi:MAG: hypothetical protein U9R74_01865 [Pseudomonadota bacterium]|nr:hypothetical protein [Pseudomonadota bacterium]